MINYVNLFLLADVLDRNSNSMETIFVNGETSKISILKLLLNNKANCNATDDYDQTPLHYAAIKGNKTAVEILLEERGIDIEVCLFTKLPRGLLRGVKAPVPHTPAFLRTFLFPVTVSKCIGPKRHSYFYSLVQESFLYYSISIR